MDVGKRFAVDVGAHHPNDDGVQYVHQRVHHRLMRENMLDQQQLSAWGKHTVQLAQPEDRIRNTAKDAGCNHGMPGG